MPVIDFESGKITQDAPDTATNMSAQLPESAPQGGRVIDLNTGKYVDTSAPAPIQAAAPETGIMDIFTGSDRIKATPELGTLPEFGNTPEGSALLAAINGGDIKSAAKISAGFLSTASPQAQLEIIQSAIPDAVFETTPDGSTIIETKTESGSIRRSVLNRPGFSSQDLTTSIAQVLAFIPAAKVATLGKNLLQKVVLGSVTAGATSQGLQEAGIAGLGRETRDLTETATATVLGGAAELVMPAIQGIKGMRQTAQVGAARDEIAQTAQSVNAAQEATAETGIPLFKAQQTGIPAQLEKQSFVAQLPAGTRSALTGLKKQNKAAGDAVETFLGQIAPDNAVVTGAENIRTAAQTAIKNAKNIRAEKSSPIYEQAFKDGADVDTKPLNDFIASQLDNLPETGEIAKTLNKVINLTKGKGGTKPSLELLHNAKIEIDQMLKAVGESSIGNTTKAKLTQAKNILLQQMDEASPGYTEARRAFADASPEVTKIQDSIIGKVAKLNDDQLKQVSSKLFSPTETNPAVILNAKKTIQDVDPEAWSQIVRVELEKRLGSVKSTQEAGTVDNLPGQLYRALFPNEKSTKILMNSLDAEGKKNLKYLQTALSRARLGRPGGSQTAVREEIKKDLQGGIAQSFRNFVRAPISSASSVLEDAQFNSRVAAMAKVFYDTTWSADMRSLRALDPNSPAAARAMTQLLNDIQSSEETKK
jgi:hypothetical protein